MNLLEAIRTRRSVRTYDPRPVPAAEIEAILRECTNAPTACNRRGWRFVLVEDREDLDWLYRQGGSSVFRKAGQALLVTYQADSDNLEWHDIEQSAAAAVMLFLLVAHTHGIGTCWICQLPSRRDVARRFHVPPDFVPVGMVTFGYYPAGLKTRPREAFSGPVLASGKFSFDVHTAARPSCGDPRISPAERTHSPGTSAQSNGAYPHPFRAPGLAVRRVLRRAFYMLPGRSLLRPLLNRFEKVFDTEMLEDQPEDKPPERKS